MQINGSSLPTHYTRDVSLPRPSGGALTLTLKPLPLGFYRRLRSRQVLPPVRPTRIARDSTGKPLRDQQGLAILVADDDDVDYRNQLELYHQRVAVLMLREALTADRRLQFDTAMPADHGNWSEYADRLYQEFEEAGFAAGDLAFLCDQIARMSNLLEQHLQQAQANFSQPQPVPTS